MKKILHSAMSGFPTSCKANFSLGREMFFSREGKDFSSGGKNPSHAWHLFRPFDARCRRGKQSLQVMSYKIVRIRQ